MRSLILVFLFFTGFAHAGLEEQVASLEKIINKRNAESNLANVVSIEIKSGPGDTSTPPISADALNNDRTILIKTIREKLKEPNTAAVIVKINPEILNNDELNILTIGSDSPGVSKTDISIFQECKIEAEKEEMHLRSLREFNTRLLVVTDTGQPCYNNVVDRSRKNRSSEGDPIVIAAFGPEDTVNQFRVDYEICSKEPEAPSLINTTAETEQSASQAKRKLVILDRRDCFGETPRAKIVNSSDQTIYTANFSQYKRFRGAFNIGVAWTDLRDGSYSSIDFGDGTKKIRDIGDDGTGPQYTASLLLYGLPRYFSKGYSYSGRDVVNERETSDRIGLVLSLGLDNPKDLFGLGLAYEVIPGMHFTVSKHYQKVNSLVGYSIGDAFTGEDSTIPTRNQWEDETVFGLSIDGRLIGSLLGGGS